MRMALRFVAPLVMISLLGSLPVRGETCEEATVPCHNLQPHTMACCTPVHCCCDLSAPVQPAPNPAPARVATGHEIVKIASLPVALMPLTDGEYLDAHSTTRADTSIPAGSYLLTHAFLI
jgi:hypothetical protein